MRVGTLEIQIMAGLARLQKDMNDAQRIVGGAMGNVERSVASAKRAMQTLGVGLPIAAITDQVRRMSDQYTKLDAQIRLATKSQAAYAQGMADIRRISTTAQADISATSMLYTRLINTMEGTGIAQSKLATVTETISFGLKAYGATTQEAASAALQLSQAMGANRLGGEEFRAVMEAMPNVMKVLADSMGVPLGQLRQLSIDGKITADEMVKAFGNPAVAAQFKALAESTQTVTGAWQVARNELMLLVGEFSKSSGLTQSAIAAFNAFAAVFRFMADNIDLLTRALGAYTAVLVGKFVVGLVQARMAQLAANTAAAEAAIANVAVAESAVFAAKANLAGAAAAARAGGSMAVASVAAKEYAASVAALAAAEKAQAASSIGIMGRVKGLAGKTGWIGMALFGAWTVYDFLNGMQQVADGADKLKNKFEGMSLAEVQMARQRELIRQIGMRGMFQDNAAIQNSQDMIRAYDQQIAKMAELQNAETAAQRTKVATIKFSHDEQVVIQRYNDLLDQKNKMQLTEAEFAAKVADLYGVGAKAAKALSKEQAALAKSQEELNKQLADGLFERQAYWQSVADETAALNDKAAQMELEISLIGATAEQEAALTRAKYDEAIATNEQLLSVELLNRGRESDIRALALHIQALYRLREAAGLKPIAEANQKIIEEQRKAHEEMWKSIDRTAHDTFVSIMNGGKDTATRLKEALKNGFFDWLYSMTLKKWIINVSGVMSGTAAGGASASGMTSGGMPMSVPGLDSGAGITALGNAIGSSMIAGVGTGMTIGLGAATEAAAAYAAAGMTMEGAALMLGAAAPWIAGIIAVAALLGGSGGPTAQSLGTTSAQFDPTGVMTSATGSGWMTRNATSDAFVAGLQSQYAATIASLGGTASATNFFFGAGQQSDGTSAMRRIAGGAGGRFFNSGEIGASDAEIQLAASRAVFAALQGSDLPQYLRTVFDGLTVSTATQQQINDTLAFAQTLKQTREALLETRTPLEVLRANVQAGTLAFQTSAATFRNDFVAAIDAGINPTVFAQWQQLGAAIDQLAAADAAAATAAVQAATDMIGRMVQSAAAALRASVGAERATLTAEYNRQLTVLKTRVDGITASIDKLTTLSGALRSSVSAMGVGATRANAQAQISSVLAIARAGGVLPNAAEIQDSLNIIAQPSEMLFGSFTDYMRDFIRTSNDIKSLSDITDTQLTTEQTALTLAQQQIDLLTAQHDASMIRLDNILASTDGTTQAILTLAQAMAAFDTATAAAAAIAPPPITNSVISGFVNANLANPMDIYLAAANNNVSMARVDEAMGWAAGTSSAWATSQGLPSFAVGVNEVPRDMVAQIHRGEEIKPAAYVDRDREARDESNRLLAEMRLELAEIKRTNLRMWQTTEQWDVEGMPEVRVEA